MNFIINGDELAAICGLPHIQQLAYLRGVRPYMDIKTAITGIKRRISYQSISEQLYIEPHQGIKSQSYFRDQIRRAVAGLERAGAVEVKSEGRQLILKCLLASQYFSTQNKATINPPYKAVIKSHNNSLIQTGLKEDDALKADVFEPSKAAIPLKEDNYIYLLQRFEQFWQMYPEKKSRDHAFDIFQQMNPDDRLLSEMLQALDKQIRARIENEVSGQWVPAWKYPANWLTQKCWQDEIKTEAPKEKGNAKRSTKTKSVTADLFWDPSTEDIESEHAEAREGSNVIELQCFREQ